VEKKERNDENAFVKLGDKSEWTDRVTMKGGKQKRSIGHELRGGGRRRLGGKRINRLQHVYQRAGKSRKSSNRPAILKKDRGERYRIRSASPGERGETTEKNREVGGRNLRGFPLRRHR